MSEASDDRTDEELERIRERKRERLESGESSTLSDDGAADGSRADADAAAAPDEPVHVETEAEFEETVAQGVVLVDFHADWCGPCKMLEPIVADIAETTDATVAKVDVDAHQGLAREYGVQGVPTLLLFVDGEPAERRVGVQDEGALRDLVAQHV
ncbi:thioredoxin [Halosimplex pelagicum]|uniref:Thioredoxin n=1 Tax=Halosimplex pelagicum TaxID=869886 RepID=A0A7D5PB88_9EURY|nr:thioredoxin [Halosimplex pelagicum]QLH83504.1 thioredoxin [Halosimplex pelagicum]